MRTARSITAFVKFGRRFQWLDPSFAKPLLEIGFILLGVDQSEREGKVFLSGDLKDDLLDYANVWFPSCRAGGSQQQWNLRTASRHQHQAKIAFDRLPGKGGLTRAERRRSRVGRATVAPDEVRLHFKASLERAFLKSGPAYPCCRKDANLHYLIIHIGPHHRYLLNQP